MTGYEIAFSGELQQGFDGEQVRVNLCKLFQTDVARIEALFSGRRTVIKKGLSQELAEKYRVALARAGALVEIINPDEQAGEPTLRQSSAPGSGESIAARDNYMAAFSHIDAPDFSIAPLGSPMQDEAENPLPPAVDLSQFSLAPPGSDMGQLKNTKAAIVPDTSHLALQ